MDIFLRKYFWTLNLALIAVCSLLAAHGVGQVVMAQVPVAARGRPAAGPTPDRVQAPDVSHVIARNIFCSTCEPPVEQKPEQQGEPGPSSSLDLRLIATLVSPSDAALSYASIQNPSDRRTRIYGVGSQLATDAVVTAIEDRRVTLERNGRSEMLLLATDSRPQAGPAPPTPRGLKMPSPVRGLEWLRKGIRKVGANRWEINRGALNKVLSDTTMIARSARVAPAVRNGKPVGFKLIRIRPGSFYSMLGMFNGDTINAVNGRPITTPDRALEVYTAMRAASHVTISFTRRGKPLTHEYTIR